jgi:hypothetical protein
MLHDTANEHKQCYLDRLFISGAAETYLKTAAEALSEGYTTCPRCIGKSARDIPDGSTSLLITIFGPKRFAEKEILSQEHEDINRGLHKNVRRQLNRIVAKRNISELVFQGRRMRTRDRAIEGWGKPDLVISFGAGHENTLAKEDVLGVVYFPKDVLRKEANPSRFQDALLYEIFSLAGVRIWLSSHFQNYGYRNLSLYYHACDSIDHHTLHIESI